MSDQTIQVEAHYVGSDQERLIRAFTANVDIDMVEVKSSDYAIKAIVPLEIIINATLETALIAFVLDPLTHPIVDKLNWKAMVAKYLNPIVPFSLVINITDDDLNIEALSIYDLDIIVNIWNIVEQTIELVKDENLIGKINKIRFTESKDNKLLICCFMVNKPICLVDIYQLKVLPISDDTEIPLLDSDLSDADFLGKELEKLAQHKYE